MATNWIKDRPEGLKLQNLTLASRTGRSTGSLSNNLTLDVHYAINRCESLGSGRQLILHGNPSAMARDCSHIWQSFDVIFLPNVHCQCCMLLQGTLGHDCDIFAASGESTAWVFLSKSRSRPIGVRVCPVAQFDFFSTAFVFWKEDSGRQRHLIHPRTKEDMRPVLHHHQDLLSLMILMFLLILLTHFQRLMNLLDLQSCLDYHQDSPAPPLAGGTGRARAESVSRERSQSREHQLRPFPMSDDDDDQ